MIFTYSTLFKLNKFWTICLICKHNFFFNQQTNVTQLVIKHLCKQSLTFYRPHHHKQWHILKHEALISQSYIYQPRAPTLRWVSSQAASEGQEVFSGRWEITAAMQVSEDKRWQDGGEGRRGTGLCSAVGEHQSWAYLTLPSLPENSNGTAHLANHRGRCTPHGSNYTIK